MKNLCVVHSDEEYEEFLKTDRRPYPRVTTIRYADGTKKVKYDYGVYTSPYFDLGSNKFKIETVSHDCCTDIKKLTKVKFIKTASGYQLKRQAKSFSARELTRMLGYTIDNRHLVVDGDTLTLFNTHKVPKYFLMIPREAWGYTYVEGDEISVINDKVNELVFNRMSLSAFKDLCMITITMPESGGSVGFDDFCYMPSRYARRSIDLSIYFDLKNVDNIWFSENSFGYCDDGCNCKPYSQYTFKLSNCSDTVRSNILRWANTNGIQCRII